jgi:hypothetical protein
VQLNISWIRALTHAPQQDVHLICQRLTAKQRRAGHSCDDRADDEGQQAANVDRPPPVEIRQAAHEGQADGVRQQVARDHPRGVIQRCVEGQPQLRDEFGQKSAHNGQVQ